MNSENATRLPDTLTKESALQRTMQRIMLRMVSVEGGELARRRVPESELAYRDDDETQRVKDVLDTLVSARLVVKGKEPDGDPFVEPAHDALVRGWDKLLEWTEQEQEQLSLRRLLTPVANDWRETPKTAGLWHFNPRLPLLKQQLGSSEGYGESVPRDDGWLNSTEAEFVEKSVERRQSTFAAIIGSVAVAFIALSLLTWFAFSERNRADGERDRADKEAHFAKETTSTTAMRTGLTVCRNVDSGYGIPWLVRSLENGSLRNDPLSEYILANLAAWGQQLVRPVAQCPHSDDVTAVIFNHDSTKLITASNDATARVWQVPSGKPVTPPLPHSGPVCGVGFSPNEDTCVTCATDGSLRFWRIEDASIDGEVLQMNVTTLSFAVNRRGTLAIAGCADGTARIWDLQKRKQVRILSGHSDGVRGVQISPNDELIATGGFDMKCILWRMNGDKVGEYYHRPGFFWSVAFSPDSSVLYAGNMDGQLLRFSTDPFEIDPRRIQHDGPIACVAASNDGQHVAAGAGHVKFWDTTYGKVSFNELTHSHDLLCLAFCGNDRFIATGSLDGVARIWQLPPQPDQADFGDLPSVMASKWLLASNQMLLATGRNGMVGTWQLDRPEKPLQPTITQRGTIAADADPTGKLILTGGMDGIVRIWDRHSGDELWQSAPLDAPAFCAVFHPTDNTFIIASSNTVQVRNKHSFEREGRPIQHPLAAPTRIAISRDGSRVAIAATSKVVIIDLAERKVTGAPLEQPDHVLCLAFSQDGDLLATGCNDNRARLWNASTQKQFGKTLAHDGTILQIAFDSKGKRLATASLDSATRLWDVQTTEQIGPSLRHSAGVSGVTFSRDDSQLLTWSWDYKVRKWPLASPFQYDLAKLQQWSETVTNKRLDGRGVTQVLSHAEWSPAGEE